MNQAEFAKRHGVSRKTVTAWKDRGWLVFDGRDIDADKSDALLAKYRKSIQREPAAPSPRTAVLRAESSSDDIVNQLLARGDPGMSLDEARRLKENYLALLTQLEYEKKEGEIVDISVARNVLFSTYRAQRDSWLNWPARVAPLMAADLDVPADKMTEILNEHVHKHLVQLGEQPDPDKFITDEN
ncbi:hypothetical protein AU577_15675 [Salmonella enterica subsp. enterica serovar Alachua]|nr:hypothetical protein [Salmonella enterica subsp. enterica serovar Alachua]